MDDLKNHKSKWELVTTALMIVALLLFVSACQNRSDDSDQTVESTLEKAAEQAGSMEEKRKTNAPGLKVDTVETVEKAASTAGSVYEKARDETEMISRTVEGVVDNAADQAGSMGEKMENTIRDLKTDTVKTMEKAASTAGGVYEKARDETGATSRTVEGAVDKRVDQGTRIVQDAKESVDSLLNSVTKQEPAE